MRNVVNSSIRRLAHVQIYGKNNNLSNAVPRDFTQSLVLNSRQTGNKMEATRYGVSADRPHTFGGLREP